MSTVLFVIPLSGLLFVLKSLALDDSLNLSLVKVVVPKEILAEISHLVLFCMKQLLNSLVRFLNEFSSALFRIETYIENLLDLLINHGIVLLTHVFLVSTQVACIVSEHTVLPHSLIC